MDLFAFFANPSSFSPVLTPWGGRLHTAPTGRRNILERKNAASQGLRQYRTGQEQREFCPHGQLTSSSYHDYHSAGIHVSCNATGSTCRARVQRLLEVPEQTENIKENHKLWPTWVSATTLRLVTVQGAKIS